MTLAYAERINILAMAAPKNNTLSLDEKMKLIDAYENQKLNIKQLRERFRCGKTQVYKILRQKAEIIKMWSQGNGSLRRKRKTCNEDVNNIVCEWYIEARAQDLPVTGALIQARAKSVAESLGNMEFKASNGWLESFRKRHNIVLNKVCEETKEINVESFEDWEKNLPTVIQAYKKADIFNCEETALLFRALPNFVFLDREKCVVDSAEKLTVFLCCSLMGEKEKPLVIGHTEKPKCFKNLSLMNLPVIWKSSDEALMNAQIMEEWLKSFNRKMRNESRKVILFLKSATCHSNVKLSNVKLEFFPVNVIGVIQPLDEGIISNMKLQYRKLMFQYLLANMMTCSNVEKITNEITTLNAVTWIASSWDNVSSTVIQKCFGRSGFPIVIDIANTTDEYEQLEILSIMMSKVDASFNCDAEIYVQMDNGIPTKAGEDKLVNNNIQNINTGDADNVMNLDTDDEDNIVISNDGGKIESYAEALKYLKQIQNFSLQVDDGELLSSINNAHDIIEKRLSSDFILHDIYV